MIDTRIHPSESSSINTAPGAPEPSREQVRDNAPPPRWGMLVAAIVAALVTAAWVTGDLSTADAGADLARMQSAQAQGR